MHTLKTLSIVYRINDKETQSINQTPELNIL